MAGDWSEVEELLSKSDLQKLGRRPHRLPDEWYRCADTVYCLTLCARQHNDPFVNPGIAAGVVEAIRHYHRRRRWKVWAYCVMPDHLHLVASLLQSPSEQVSSDHHDPDLRKLVGAFKRFTTTQIAWKHGITGTLWQRDFYDHVPRNVSDVEEQCRYVLNNPVRKGLVEEWSCYRWSGALDDWQG